MNETSTNMPRTPRADAFSLELTEQFKLEYDTVYKHLLKCQPAFGRQRTVQMSFVLEGEAFTRIMKKYIPNYEDGTIQYVITLTRDALVGDLNENHEFYCSGSIFYYNDEDIAVTFDTPLVGEDTRAPDIIDILQACVDQKTANPVIHIEQFSSSATPIP